jgi:hypothetical protein
MHFRMHGVVSTTDTDRLDLGRYLSISAAANDGALSAVAALVVLIVLFWALTSPFWEIPDEPAAAPGHADPRSHAGATDATSPIPRTVRVGAYQGPRHAAGAPRMPKVSGAPPWGPAPKPPGLPPAG